MRPPKATVKELAPSDRRVLSRLVGYTRSRVGYRLGEVLNASITRIAYYWSYEASLATKLDEFAG